MALLMMTILSTAIAAATTVMAWRLARRETRRSDARVAALASAIFGPEGPATVENANAIASFPSEYQAAPADGGVGRLTGHRPIAMLSAVAVVVAGLLIAGANQRFGHGSGVSALSTTAAATARSTSAQPAVAAAPLELIALTHERGKNTLIVRGTIRNPSNGTACEMPAVVVLTFDEHGIFLGSSEADTSGERLRPGARAAFNVTVAAGPTPPSRYRVSFRSAGHVVPHVDRREPDAAVDGASKAPRQAGAARPVQS